MFCFNVLDTPETSQYDIGNFTDLDKDMDEVKCNLLKNYLKPNSNYIFPAMFWHGSDKFLLVNSFPFLAQLSSEKTAKTNAQNFLGFQVTFK